MAGTKTLGNLKARVADELDRSDLAPQIALAIEDAITEAASNRFWFNEVRGLAIPLSAGMNYYTSDSYVALTEIDNIYFLTNGVRRKLYEESNNWLDELVTGSVSQGEPYLYSRYGDSLRVYPDPNAAYTLYVDGVSRLPALTSDNAYNAWTNEGERLVRALAKRTLLVDVIRDMDEAQVQEQLVQRYTKELLDKSFDRASTGRMWSSDDMVRW